MTANITALHFSKKLIRIADRSLNNDNNNNIEIINEATIRTEFFQLN